MSEQDLDLKEVFKTATGIPGEFEEDLIELMDRVRSYLGAREQGKKELAGDAKPREDFLGDLSKFVRNTVKKHQDHPMIVPAFVQILKPFQPRIICRIARDILEEGIENPVVLKFMGETALKHSVAGPKQESLAEINGFLSMMETANIVLFYTIPGSDAHQAAMCRILDHLPAFFNLTRKMGSEFEGVSPTEHLKDVAQDIAKLPEDQQGSWIEKVEATRGKFISAVLNDFDKSCKTPKKRGKGQPEFKP